MDNCKIPTNADCKSVQPISKANYFDFEFETEYNLVQSKNIAVIGTPSMLTVIDESKIAPMISLDAKGHLNITQMQIKDHIFCGLKFQVSDMVLFNKKPKIVYLSGDQFKEIEINFANYLTEFAYKNNILTVPLRFLADNRFLMYWELPMPIDVATQESAVVTLDIEKVLSQSYGI